MQKTVGIYSEKVEKIRKNNLIYYIYHYVQIHIE